MNASQQQNRLPPSDNPDLQLVSGYPGSIRPCCLNSPRAPITGLSRQEDQRRVAPPPSLALKPGSAALLVAPPPSLALKPGSGCRFDAPPDSAALRVAPPPSLARNPRFVAPPPSLARNPGSASRFVAPPPSLARNPGLASRLVAPPPSLARKPGNLLCSRTVSYELLRHG